MVKVIVFMKVYVGRVSYVSVEMLKNFDFGVVVVIIWLKVIFEVF